MRDYSSTISAFQGVLSKFVFDEPVGFPEDFAQKRYLKKMETPDSQRSKDRKTKCWLDYLANDESLPSTLRMPSREWYKARHALHNALGSFRHGKGSIDFPKGSEVNPTSGCNSIESRLCKSQWTVTYDAFDDFCQMCYAHKALKRALKRRYKRWYDRKQFMEKMSHADRILYNRFRTEEDPPFAIFRWKLSQVVTFTQGSRFSCVPKNNEKDRPINIEPLCNQLVQRRIGNEIRTLLNEVFNIDLDTLAKSHERMISRPTISTIDLKDASDSVSIALCEFLFPRWFFNLLMSARSPFLYGLDKSYHSTKKISSMGNGFTFELMTLILTSLCKTLDPDSSVFGDDIIIDSGSSSRLIQLLEEVGFRVNVDKTFTSGPFRESCGANFHSDFGYIRSYDFLYPQTLQDCMVAYNKAHYLGLIYESFGKLHRALHRFVPKALQGGPIIVDLIKDKRWWDHANQLLLESQELSNFFMTGVEFGGNNAKTESVRRTVAEMLQYPYTDVRSFIGIKYVPDLRTKHTRNLSSKHHWAKYEMYLHSGRASKDILTSSGRWVTCTYLSIGGGAFRSPRLEGLSAVA